MFKKGNQLPKCLFIIKLFVVVCFLFCFYNWTAFFLFPHLLFISSMAKIFRPFFFFRFMLFDNFDFFNLFIFLLTLISRVEA